MRCGDDRFQPAINITDGRGRFEVVSVRVTHGEFRARDQVYAEDCKTLAAREHTADAVRRDLPTSSRGQLPV